MSGYPPGSSYGPPPGLTTLNGSSYQPQHVNNQQQYQQYDNTQYDYSNHQSDPNASAFNNNAAYQGGYPNPVPPFSAAAVASGVPPLPIYPQWQMDNNALQAYGNSSWGPPTPQPPQQQYQYQQPHQQQHQPQQPQHIRYDQQGYAPNDPFNAGMHLNNTSVPSPMSFTPQPMIQAPSQPPSQPQPQTFAPPTGPRARPPVDEGELSEGEYVPSPQRLPPRSRDRERHNKTERKRRENGPMQDRNGRQASPDHYSPTQQFRSPSFSRQSSHSSQGREMRKGHRIAEHKQRKQEARARKETAREAARKESPPTSRRQSLADPAPVIEQLPLPKLPPAVPQALQDARKQAQNAVLNLLPLKVRFENYLEEGIDEDVIRNVFADVGLPATRDSTKVVNKPVSKPAHPPQPTVLPGLSAIAPPKAALQEKSAAPPPKEKNDTLFGLGNRKPASISAASAGNKAEERKDRIARLLAAKNEKTSKPAEPSTETAAPVAPPAASDVPIAPVAQKPSPSPAPLQHPLPPRPKPAPVEASEPQDPTADVVVAAAPKVDKDTLLRQKMEALKKRQAVVDKDALLRKKMEEMEVSRNLNQTQALGKDAILRQKMEALNESRRKREQEALAKQAAQQSLSDGASSQSFHADMSNFNPLAQFQSSFPPVPALPLQNGMPAIPGLFLGVQPADPSSQPTATPSAAPVNSRKRPVASDFDSGASTPPTYKKPFGYFEKDRFILDVSEPESGEEDEDEDETDIDEASDTFGRDTNMPAKPHMRDLPPLSDFPPKRAYTAPTSAVGTPPVSQSLPRPAARPEDLKRKEFEIQEMRRKIAEAEERKKAKLAAVGSSNSTSETPTPPGAPASVDRIETSNQIERLMSDASHKIEEDQQKLAATQMLQEQKAIDLKRAQEEQRRKRQAELAANLPAVDADVQETQRRLAELRAEMQRLEADMQKKLDDKRRLAEEMEKLNVEADEQLKAQKEQLNEINNDIAHVEQVTVSESAEADLPAASAHVLADDAKQASSTSPSYSPSFADEGTADGKSPGSVEQAASPIVQVQHAKVNGIKEHASSDEELVSHAPNSITNGSPTKSMEDKEMEMSSGSESTPMIESSDSDRSKSGERGVTVRERSSSSDPSDQSMDESSSAEMEIDEAPIQVAHSPAQAQESTSSESSSEEPSGSSDEDSNVKGGSHHENDVNVEDAEMPDVSETSSEGSTSNSDSEAEEYEPPAASLPQAPDAIVARSASNSIAPETISREAASSPARATPPAAVAAPTVAQLTSEPVDAISTNEAPKATQGANNKKPLFFTPYESPLKSFHSYRFHPHFTKEVRGGYKSMTYSNNIKDDDEFCRFELAGGTCNDKDCGFQHFRDAVLPDGAILEVLGNPKGLAEDEKMRFITGLKQVLSELRAKNVRSFDQIATSIVEFRQEFFDDKSKVLPLGGNLSI